MANDKEAAERAGAVEKQQKKEAVEAEREQPGPTGSEGVNACDLTTAGQGHDQQLITIRDITYPTCEAL